MHLKLIICEQFTGWVSRSSNRNRDDALHGAQILGNHSGDEQET